MLLMTIIDQKLNKPLRLLPNGYTNKALMNNPTAIPIAICTIDAATSKTTELSWPELNCDDAPSVVLFVNKFAV